MESREVAAGDIRSLGLVDDPFRVVDDGSGNAPGVKLAINAAALRLFCAIEASAADPSHRPIVIEKNRDIPAYYPVAALARVFSGLSDETPVAGILQSYIPLDMMRVGRVRSLLNVVSGRVAGTDPAGTIGMWSREAFVEPDESLEEWAAIRDTITVADILDEIDQDPRAFCERIFGEVVESRSGAENIEQLMRVSTSRQDRLETDPEEGVELAIAEDPESGDLLDDAFIVPLGELDAEALPEPDPATAVDGLIADYIIAFTKEHLSPVVARGIAAFRAQGVNSMAEELKITKAPSKTVHALYRFARPRFRSGAVIYDRLEMWENVPTELRTKIVGTMTELRWALKDDASLVLMLVPGTCPEIEEGFASAIHVSWSFKDVEPVSQPDSPFDRAIAAEWLASASLSTEAPAWGDALFDAIPEGTTLASAATALSRAIEHAVDAGLAVPDPAVVVAALDAEKEAAPA